ncbi:sulfatase [Catalinimonas niigatensis]|uniref:sulfatase n=1 Tax=Catalinimonas niigatensis TaxID=1397264 RepID=UPI002665DD26|nr:sulfatase [Catalinimonas niigatensis]WPP53114.1 sulfatase [Catalinimonas niigatensis]
MENSVFRILLILAFISFLYGCGEQASSEERRRPPNFVFILVDDLGWTDLSCFGSSFYETPNIDKLAASGMKFTNAYAACPVCSPTRASILTGKYPARIDATDWFGAPQPSNIEKHWTKDKPLLPAAYTEYMKTEEKTLAEALKEAGYATFFAGKWHLGDEEKYYPEQQGFDINIGGYFRGGPYTGNQYFSPYDNPKMENGPEGEHLPDRLATETAKFIEQHKDSTFLAYLSFYSVHTPLMAREDLEKKYQAKKDSLGLEDEWGQEGERQHRLVQSHPVYAGMIEAMDQAVGKVLDQLKTSGVEDNTVVIFMSDNGGLATSEGHPTTNLPLRAGKGWLYEGGIREPMIVRWPGVTQTGSESHVTVTSTDFYPSMLEMAGITQLPEQHTDGKSFVNVLEGSAEPIHDAIFWHYPHYGNQGGSPGSAIRKGDWKLIHWYEDDRFELFNLKEDIGEEQNVASEHPKEIEILKKELNEWLQDVDGKMPSPNPNAEERRL